MTDAKLGAGSAILFAGLIAGILDLAAVLAFWAAKGVAPGAILQSIATARFGAAAFDHGMSGALIGLFLHFAVSFVFAAGYVAAASQAPMLRSRPVACGIAYGLIAYVVMTVMVVPLSNATFGGAWPPPAVNLAVSLFIHIFLFGLPIALVARRVPFESYDERPGAAGRFSFGIAGGILWAGLIAGIVEIAAVFAVWLASDVGPVTILQSIASALLGREAFAGGAPSALLGLFLHFLLSIVFAAGYVAVSTRVILMRFHPVMFGLVYGLVVHWIMSALVLPLSFADFGAGSESPNSYALTLLIHMTFFGLPIALVASRIRRGSPPDRDI